jgi:hypothetical protein
MLTITATYGSNASGATTITAKGHGKQRTVKADPEKSVSANFGSAVGALVDVLTTPEQQAKMRHPSAKGRCMVESMSDAGGKQRWTIDV